MFRNACPCLLEGMACSPGNDSRTVFQQLLHCMGGHERHTNKLLLKAASTISLSQDAKAPCLALRYTCVVWKLPPALCKRGECLPNGVRSIVGNGGPPFHVDRVLRMIIQDDDPNAQHIASWIVSSVADVCGDVFDVVRLNVREIAVDNAGDEGLAGKYMMKAFPNMSSRLHQCHV